MTTIDKLKYWYERVNQAKFDGRPYLEISSIEYEELKQLQKDLEKENDAVNLRYMPSIGFFCTGKVSAL